MPAFIASMLLKSGLKLSPEAAKMVGNLIAVIAVLAIIYGCFWYLRSLTSEIQDLTAKTATAEQTITQLQVDIANKDEAIKEIRKNIEELNGYYADLKKYDEDSAKKLAKIAGELAKLRGITDTTELSTEAKALLLKRITCLEIASGKPNTAGVDCK